MKDKGQVETVDEFPTWKEARKMLAEYRLAFGPVLLYLSRRCTKEWRESCES
jgi:hypothetical protein